MDILEKWNSVTNKYLCVAIPLEGKEPKSPNHTVSFYKNDFVELCQKVADQNGYKLVKDYIRLGKRNLKVPEQLIARDS